MTFTITARFQDKNMPAVHEETSTYQAAVHAVDGFYQRLAALRSVTITHPDGDKDIFAPAYLFTVPKL